MEKLQQLSDLIEALTVHCEQVGESAASDALAPLYLARAEVHLRQGDKVAALRDAVDAAYLFNLVCEEKGELESWSVIDDIKSDLAELDPVALASVADLVAAAEGGSYVCAVRERLEAWRRKVA